jgi:hypothetical protein
MAAKRAARRYVDPGMSANCRAQHGFPHRTAAAGCTGCSCDCHAVRPPADFRATVDAARTDAAARRATDDEDGN